jgi:V/A-type H+/Na+-transporting ATPase subunit F
MKIALVADESTVNCFKLAGLSNTYNVKDSNEAEKQIRALLKLSNFAIIITTDNLANKIRDTINEITEEYEYPIIISIPNIDRDSKFTLDQITELIKRKTGIELK